MLRSNLFALIAHAIGRETLSLVLTERERKILRLNAEGLSDYQIAKKLKVETPNVYRARKTALKKLEQAMADLSFADSLKQK
jgi:DNA-binding NarL/FixJ family response regulator